ncbi:MAG: DNA polymerase III subunit gamma/tau [Anaerolinea sp.]|nr:DNA polymerase III subunit gamma/tau [Anaerolinea sp.]
MSQAFYRKWRPHQWAEVVSQEHVVRTLKNAILSGHIGHAYLFSGPRGTGKTTTARLLAKAVNCLAENPADRPCDACEHCLAVNEGRFLDLIEIDAASNTSVDDVRELRDKINFSPSQGRYKVYIIDEVHMLSTAAFNALLKTLEEPPAHAIFILATTEMHKIPATVLSRCQRHEFRRIPVNDIAAYLQKMCQQEGIQAEPEALLLIARQSTGAMRDAISLLDQLASTGERITLSLAQQVLGAATSQMVIEMVEALLARQSAAGLDAIHRSLDSGVDARQFARQVVEYLRSLLLIHMGSGDQVDAPTEQRARMASQANAFALPHLLETLRLFNAAANEARNSWQPGLMLEMALAEAIAWQAAPQPAQATTLPPTALNTSAASTQPATLPALTESAPLTPPSTRPALDAPSRETAQPAPPPPSTEPEASPPPSAEGTLNLSTLQKNWASVRAQVKRKRQQTEALLNSCTSLQIKDGVIVLVFSSDLLKSKMEANDNIEITRQAISSVLGIPAPALRCISAQRSGGAQSQQDLSTPDGMIKTALDLGAKIVHKD